MQCALFVVQRFDGIQPRRLVRRVEAEEDTHHQGEEEGDDHDLRGDDGGKPMRRARRRASAMPIRTPATPPIDERMIASTKN